MEWVKGFNLMRGTMPDDAFIPDTAKLAVFNLDAYPQGKLLAETITRCLLSFGRFPQSMKSGKGKGEVCDIIPALIEEIVAECLDLLGKPDAELIKETARITRQRVRELKHESRWRDRNPKDCYCKRCRRCQDVTHHNTETRTLTMECGHTRKIPKDGIQRSKSEWIIEHPREVSEEDTPSGVVQGCDNQIDEGTGQQFHSPLSDVGNDPFGGVIDGVSRFGNRAEDALIAQLDYWKRESKILSCIGADNYRWLADYYGRVGDGTLTNAEHQKCFRLCEKLRNTLNLP